MKLGFVSAILGNMNFEEVIDTAHDLGFQCVEMACWPVEKAARKYAGVSHIDISNLDDAMIEHIQSYCRNKNIEISSLAYYPNMLDEDLEKRGYYINHLKNLIIASSKLDINMVTTFVGRMQNKNIEENFVEFEKVWKPIIAFAESYKVKVGIENCPMLFTKDEWPGGQNIATSPANWRRMFGIIPSEYFGLNYDPSHFVWQQMDYIKPIYEFKDKIFHVHYKDIKLDKSKMDNVGIMAYPLEYMNPKIPGYGDVNWSKYVSALSDIGYNGYTCIEVEDRSFEANDESILNSLKLSKRYMDQFVI